MTSGSPIKSSFLRKGSVRATGIQEGQCNDFDDANINPVITYRHILSQNLGVRDPLRVIALCDSDAFYANCEMVRLGLDQDTPLVVLQWDMLIAVNYPARKYGISRMDRKKDALERCPHLKVVHVATYKEGDAQPEYWDDVDTRTHKVSLDHYRRESMRIVAMLKESLPGCEVEKASIDEVFIDFTKPVREVLLQRYPYITKVPADGVDTPLPPPPTIEASILGNLIPIHPLPPEEANRHQEQTEAGSHVDLKPKEEDLDENATRDMETSNDEPPMLVAETAALPITWHDVALSIAAEMMQKARDDVRTKLGYSTSAGIARNKFLAKLTASYKKPNSQTILRNMSIPNYLKPLKFQKIRFLGGKLGKAIAEEYDASTVGELLSIELDEIQNKFGEQSIWVYEILRGIDRNEGTKVSRTCGGLVNNIEVKDKGSALNKSMLASKNLPKPIKDPSEGQRWIRVLAAELALRLNDARQMSPNLWPKTLVLHAKKGYEATRSKQAPFPFMKEVTVDTIANAGNKLWKELIGNQTKLYVTNVHLAFTGIEFAESGQQTIEGFLRASSSRKRSQDGEISEVDTAGVIDALQDDPSYVCPRCGQAFSLPKTNLGEDGTGDSDLLRVMLEHKDFHFAQDLAGEGQPRSKISVSSPQAPASARSSKKQRSNPKGIEKFFRKS